MEAEMTASDPNSESSVFAHARGLGPQVSAPTSSWTVVLGIIAAVAIGGIVFVSLQADRTARVRAADKAYQAAHPPYVPPPPAPVMVVPESVVPAAQVTPVPETAPGTPQANTVPEAAQRYRAPAMIVDLSGQQRSALVQAAVSLPGQSRTNDDSSRMTAEEKFAERVSGGAEATARATQISNPTFLATQGMVIPAVLETAIDSSLPGFARAVVTRDVRGFDGRVVLIPRGSKLLGQYRSAVASGQTRAFVVWSRVLTPSGVSVDIGSTAADRLGRGGLAGETDSHFFRRFGSSILLSVLSAGLDAAVGNNGSSNNAIIIGSQGQAASIAQAALQKEIDIAPTLRAAQGEPIRVFVARDLDFSGIQANPPAP